MRQLALALTGCALVAMASGAARAADAHAAMINAEGKSMGEVALDQTPNGVLLSASLTGLPPGTHAFHIHGVGKCEAPFKSAGGHYNPGGKKHGIQSAEGHHAGDMPNIHVGADGALEFEVLNPHVSLGSGSDTLFDGDGSAIVIHAGADDYQSDPAGAAGPRIACGVIAK